MFAHQQVKYQLQLIQTLDTALYSLKALATESPCRQLYSWYEYVTWLTPFSFIYLIEYLNKNHKVDTHTKLETTKKL